MAGLRKTGHSSWRLLSTEAILFLTNCILSSGCNPAGSEYGHVVYGLKTFALKVVLKAVFWVRRSQDGHSAFNFQVCICCLKGLFFSPATGFPKIIFVLQILTSVVSSCGICEPHGMMLKRLEERGVNMQPLKGELHVHV